jgi:hypothetical protein
MTTTTNPVGMVAFDALDPSGVNTDGTPGRRWA